MVSVIIPIYNLASYLEKCLDSLLVQNNQDFEILLINDGSTDSSEEICLRYCEKDNRVKYFYKDNGGVSSARNLGIANASGEWIVFVDGDDIVDADYLTVTHPNVDIIEKSFDIIENNVSSLARIISEDSILEGQAQIQKYYADYIQANSATLCNKLIRRSIIEDERYNETMKMGEDFMFFMSIFHKINSYALSSKGCYYYIRRNSSASMTIDADYKGRLSILFRNSKELRRITSDTGIDALGVSIYYNNYFKTILRYQKLFSVNDWLKVSKMWVDYFFAPKSLLLDREKREISLMPLRYCYKKILNK